MRGTNVGMLRKKILKDVDEIKNNARFIMELSDDDRVVFINENHEYGLNVIAVLGPIKSFVNSAEKIILLASESVEEALLAEIGIGATYPYRMAKRLNRKEGQSHEIFTRKKLFNLSPEQYQSIASVMFRIIELLAYKKVINRKWGQYSDKKFEYSFRRGYWSRRKEGRKTRWATPRIAENGARFSISIQDKFFLSDIYWAELALNCDMRDRIKRLANSIDHRLNKDGHKYEGRIEFSKLQRAKDIKEQLLDSHLIKHHFVKAVQDLKRRGQYYWMNIADTIAWDGIEPEEDKLVKSILPDPKSRLSDIRLKVTTGLDTKKDHVVFEVLPRDFRNEK